MTTANRTPRIEQSTNAVLMIRPCRFYPNPETAADNSFQQSAAADVAELSAAARAEFDRAVETLRRNGVVVHVVDDTATPEKPDAVFPNNWISTHHDGRIVLYPMYSAVRRRERRWDVVDHLRKHYRIADVIDYSALETDGRCLEGTGSLVLDHVNQIAYVSLSRRAHPDVLRRFCSDFRYEPVTFTSFGADELPIYHTNVMMCVASEFALVALEMVRDEAERTQLRERLARAGKEVIALTAEQVANFAGNAIELHDMDGKKLLVISARGVQALTNEQRAHIERFARFVPLEIPTIELGGGSARCMLATIHLPPL